MKTMLSLLCSVIVSLSTAQAERTIIFVGVPTLPVKDMGKISNAASLADYPAKCVIVSTPDGKHWQATLPGDATEAEIRAMCRVRDALDEVNDLRAARGLSAYRRDDGLMIGAKACADFRAANGMSGHTNNDFSFLPGGSFAPSAGCAAWPHEMGFGACCVYDDYTFAGAATTIGRDGRAYHHLFVR